MDSRQRSARKITIFLDLWRAPETEHDPHVLAVVRHGVTKRSMDVYDVLNIATRQSKGNSHQMGP